MKLFWFTVNDVFMIYLPLLCGRPEVLQCYAFPCPRWLTLDCKCTRTSKHRWNQETFHTSGLEGSIASLKCHVVTPSQRIICFAFLPVSFIETPQYFQFLTEKWKTRKNVFFALIETVTEENRISWLLRRDMPLRMSERLMRDLNKCDCFRR